MPMTWKNANDKILCDDRTADYMFIKAKGKNSEEIRLDIKKCPTYMCPISWADV